MTYCRSFIKKRDISGFMYWNDAAQLLEPAITAIKWSQFRPKSEAFISTDILSANREVILMKSKWKLHVLKFSSFPTNKLNVSVGISLILHSTFERRMKNKRRMKERIVSEIRTAFLRVSNSVALCSYTFWIAFLFDEIGDRMLFCIISYLCHISEAFSNLHFPNIQKKIHTFNTSFFLEFFTHRLWDGGVNEM